MASFEAEELRTVIKMCISLNKTLSQTVQMLQYAKVKEKVCRSLGYKWHRRFSGGRNTNKNDGRSDGLGIVSEGLVTSLTL